MTTIAVDSLGLLAADGQTTCGGTEIVRLDTIKALVAHGRVYALVGTGGMRDALIEWHRAGADPANVPKGDDWTLLVCDQRDGLMTYSNDCLYPTHHVAPFAMGSGERFALGAMLAGADARRAVEIAASKCILTGGKITTINMLEVFQQKGARRAALV